MDVRRPHPYRPPTPHSHRVFTCARNAADLEELLAHCTVQGWDVHGLAADVSKAEDRQRLIAAVSEAYGGRLNVLFNNVGTNVRKLAVDYTQVSWAMKTSGQKRVSKPDARSAPFAAASASPARRCLPLRAGTIDQHHPLK